MLGEISGHDASRAAVQPIFHSVPTHAGSWAQIPWGHKHVHFAASEWPVTSKLLLSSSPLGKKKNFRILLIVFSSTNFRISTFGILESYPFIHLLDRYLRSIYYLRHHYKYEVVLFQFSISFVQWQKVEPSELSATGFRRHKFRSLCFTMRTALCVLLKSW